MLSHLRKLLIEDRAVESALPLLVAVQMAPKFAEAEFVLFGSLQFVDRWAWVLAMVAYAWWLGQVAPLREWQRHALVGLAALAVTIMPAERALAMPVIGLFQAAILVGLWQWWDEARRSEEPEPALVGVGLSVWFLGVTMILHGIGSTMLFAVCQLALPAGLLMAPGAGMACNVALGPWAMIGMFGAALIAWSGLAVVTVCRDRPDG